MAVGCLYPNFLIPNKSIRRVLMLHNGRIQPAIPLAPPSKSFMIKKVFEDEAKGIICYRDHLGEMVCEGYDEGPRFCFQSSQNAYSHRHKEHPVPNFLQKKLLQVVGDADFNYVSGITLGEHN